MKQHKLALIISIITTALSLVGFLCSSLICFNENNILKDLCAAILSSSIFVIALSIIGYCVEKKHLQEKILTNNFFNGIDALLSVIGENYTITRQGVNIFIIDLMARTMGIRELLAEYYSGLFIKDNQLQDLINVTLRDFGKALSKLEQYNAYPSYKVEVVYFYISELITNHEKVTNLLDDWMKKKKFKMGKEFDFGENFIADYEDKALQNKQDN